MGRFRFNSTPTLAMALLLGINLFNYIDRYVLAAVEPRIRAEFFGQTATGTLAKTGTLAMVFLISYMLAAPIFGWLADRMSRWLLIGLGVIVWSLASGGSGWAPTFRILLMTRMFVGIGEAGYGPAAPTLIADLFPIEKRGRAMAWFYMAIPVGSALGYALGGIVAQYWQWRVAFYAVVPPGLALGVLALMMRDVPRGQSEGSNRPARAARWRDYKALLTTPSYVLDTLGMVALTFAIGGISYFMPGYLEDRYGRVPGALAKVNTLFGATMVVAGIAATLLGGMAGDALRKRWSGSYFLVSGAGILISCPLILVMLWTPFPYAWGVIFLAIFFLFFNTGPSNTILANVTRPSVRATGFALNIFIIHALGDAISPPLLGKIVGPVKIGEQLVYRWNTAFYAVVAVMVLGGIFWLWGARHLQRDMQRAEQGDS
jgi:MFS transporter, Spinster family, sphingosine-1-phosphate transporter